jgi:hypothetical protein
MRDCGCGMKFSGGAKRKTRSKGLLKKGRPTKRRLTKRRSRAV